MTFDPEPLDPDAEEPPEFQGEPRSSKGQSGSVTSPQANIHRLPFFKKVTRGPPATSLAPPPTSANQPVLLILTRVAPPSLPQAPGYHLEEHASSVLLSWEGRGAGCSSSSPPPSSSSL